MAVYGRIRNTLNSFWFDVVSIHQKVVCCVTMPLLNNTQANAIK